MWAIICGRIFWAILSMDCLSKDFGFMTSNNSTDLPEDELDDEGISDLDNENSANDEAESTVFFTASAEHEGDRLDRFISGQMEQYTRTRVKELIKGGNISRGEKVINVPNSRVREGDIYKVDLPPAAPAFPLPENIPLKVIYEDEHLIVIDKPAGLVVHPATGHWQGTLVNALLYHCGDSLSGVGGVKRPGIVHRLDRYTTGLMVAAKNDVAHLGLSEQFADHGRQGPLTRAYTALVWGEIDPSRGTIESQIGRSPKNPLKMDVLKEGGKFAITHYETVEKYGHIDKPTRLGGGTAAVSKVICRLETGRTHQIRVHLTHLGHPLIADPLYGTGFRTKAEALSDEVQLAIQSLNRQALHATQLGFSHPVTGEYLEFSSTSPPDMESLENLLKGL